MGVDITFNDNTIWSPSLRVGRVFYEQLLSLERLVDIKSGITDNGMDEFEIDHDQFTKFTEYLSEYLNKTNNEALFVLSSGIFQILLVLKYRIDGDWMIVPDRLRPILAKAHELPLVA